MIWMIFAWTDPAAAVEKRVALVIGNSAYPAAPLRNPLNDARALAKSLNQLGFEVLLKTNLSQRGMIEAIRDFSAKLKEGDVALFYYSGHGMQIKGRNYLIPVDADIRAEDEVPYLSFDVSQVLDKLEFAHTRVNLVILDACRNNPFIRTFRSSRVGLAQMDAPGGTLIAFSTAPGSEARDGDTDLGTYTKHLINQVATPGLPVEVMFRRVREGVTAETKDRQIPWESSSLKGDFYFSSAVEKQVVAAPTPAPAPNAAQQVDPVTVELAFWDSIKASTNRADFEAYLDQYPNGRFSALARNRLKAVQQASAAPVPPQSAQPEKAASDTEKSRQAEMEKMRAELQTLRESAAYTQASAPVMSFASEWAQRTTIIEKSPGELTLSRALSLLLDINAPDELDLVRAYESQINHNDWSNALAMGVNAKGGLIWGGGYRLKTPASAVETALEQCMGKSNDNCKTVMINGKFEKKNFLEMSKQLGAQPVTSVRQAFFRSLAQRPIESTVGNAGGSQCSTESCNSIGFASIRE